VTTLELAFSPRQKQAIALGLVAAIMLVLAAIAVEALLARADHHLRLATLLHGKQVYAELLADLPQRRLAIERLNRLNASDPIVLAPTQASLAASQLQSSLNSAIGTLSTGPASVAMEVQARKGEPVIGIAARLGFASDIAGLTQILYRLSQMKPHLFVERLEIADPNAMPGAVAPPPGPRQLRIEILVKEYMRAT